MKPTIRVIWLTFMGGTIGTLARFFIGDVSGQLMGLVLVNTLGAAALGALFTNLAKGCEKQYRPEESQLFSELAAFYQANAAKPETASLSGSSTSSS